MSRRLDDTPDRASIAPPRVRRPLHFGVLLLGGLTLIPPTDAASSALASFPAGTVPGSPEARANVPEQRGVRAWVQHGERRVRVLGMAFNRTAVPGRFDRRIPPSGQAGYVSLIVSGEEHGWWTLPEVDDEVVLGFLEGDPDRPLVLGLTGARKDRPAEPAPADGEWQRVRIRYRMVQQKS